MGGSHENNIVNGDCVGESSENGITNKAFTAVLRQNAPYFVVWRMWEWNQLKRCHKLGLAPIHGEYMGRNSENGRGNIFLMHYKECSLGLRMRATCSHFWKNL